MNTDVEGVKGWISLIHIYSYIIKWIMWVISLCYHYKGKVCCPTFFSCFKWYTWKNPTVLRWISVDILHCFVDGFGNKTRIDYGTGVYMLLVGVDLSDENWGKLEA